MSDNLVLVIAPSLRDFENYMREKLERERWTTPGYPWLLVRSQGLWDLTYEDIRVKYKHVRDPDRMRGIQNATVEWAGDYWNGFSLEELDELRIQEQILKRESYPVLK